MRHRDPTTEHEIRPARRARHGCARRRWPRARAARPRAARTVLGSILVAVVLTAGACSESDPATSETGLARSEFVEVVVALRNAEIELTEELEDDSALDARFGTARDSILDAHGTTQEELFTFLERHPDVQYQDEVWDTITQRLKRLSPNAEARQQRSRQVTPELGEPPRRPSPKPEPSEGGTPIRH